MATDLATLGIKIEVDDIKAAIAELNRLEGQSKKTEKSFFDLEKISEGLGKKLIGLASVGGAIAFANLTKDALQFADSIAKTANAIGLSTNALQEYRFAGERSGITTQTMDTALQRFTRRLGEAAQGTGVLLPELERYNIAIEDANGNIRNAEDVLNDYGNALAGAGSDQEKLRLAVAAFDTEGARMVNVLGQGAQGLEELRQQARDAGVVMDAELIQKAEIINDKWDTFTTNLSTKFKERLISFASVFVDFGREAELLAKIKVQEKILGDLPEQAPLVKVTTENLKVLRAELAALQQTSQQTAGATSEASVLAGVSGSEQEILASSLAKLQELKEQDRQRELELAASHAMAISNAEIELLRQREEEKTLIEQEAQEQRRLNTLAAIQEEDKARQDEVERRIQAEQRANSTISNMRMSVAQQAISLVRMVAGDNEKVAKALIIVEKGLGIAQVMINTQVAAMRALAELGPIAGPPAAAKIQTLGNISAGLIAATGLAQLSGAGATGGGAGAIGSISSATPAAPSLIPQQQFDQQASRSVTVIFNGPTMEGFADELIPILDENINQNDIIMIRGDSAQAQEILRQTNG